MNKYFLPLYHSELKPWIKWWILKRLNGSVSTLKAVTISSGTLKKVDKSKALSIKEYYGNTVQDGTPTPDSPIPVQTISGDITFTINGGDYIVDFGGKNKLDISNMQTGTKNGITITKNDTTGEITISGTATAYTPYNIPCNLSGTNTYSCDNWGKITLFLQYNGAGIPQGSNIIANKTYTGNVNNIVLAISRGDTVNKTIRLQAEKGTVATPYSPYVANPIELCKIGDYKDKIVNDNGTWKVEKNIGKVVLNGTETWKRTYVSNSSSYAFWQIYADLNIPNGIYGSKLCDRFEYQQKFWSDTTPNHLGENGTSSLSILFNVDTTIATTIEEWTTWLSTHNTTVYYILANPTYEVITNTNLISQLNALYEFYVNSSTVNVSNNSEIPLEVLLEYYGR